MAKRVVLSVCGAIFVVAALSQLAAGDVGDADVAYAIAVAGVGLGMGPRWGVLAAAVATVLTLTIPTGGGPVVEVIGYFALGALSGTAAEGLRGARDVRLRHLAQVVAQTDAAILSISLPGGLVTSWNPRCEELLGWSADEVLGRDASFLVGGGRHSTVREHAEAVLGGKRIALESRWATRAGGTVDVSVTAAPLTAGGAPIGASIVAIDISRQAAAVHALGQSEDRFREAFAHAPAGMAVVSHEPPSAGRLLQVNPALSRITGLSEQQLLETGFDHLLRDDPRAAGSDREARLVRPGGELIWVQVSSSPVEDQAGVVTHSIAQVQDITARKVAETVSSRLAAIVADSSDAIVAEGLDGIIVHWNRAAEELYGYTRDEAIGLHASTLVPVAMRDGEQSRFDAVLRGNSIAARETQRQTRAGQVIDVSVTLSPIRDDHGTIVGVSSIVRDITQEKVAVATLRASEELLRSIVETAGEGILVVDRDGVITFANETMGSILGVSPGEMLGKPYTAFMPDDPYELERGRATMRSRHAGVSDRHEYPYTRPDGSDGWLVVSGGPMYGPQGEITGSLAMMTEITDRVAAGRERESMEAVLHQSQRLESLGELAGGVAHDMNNLLAVITNFADFALAEVADGPGTDELNEIRRASSSAAGLIRQLLLFARQQVTESEIFAPNELLADHEDILRQLAGPTVELTTDYSEHLPSVNVDPGMFEQVAMNLVVNARDAMPEGGVVSIATAKVAMAADEVAGVEAGDYVVLRVIDAGEGMTPEVAARAFDPFFSTKSHGGGTGLGLATVYGIAKRFGGHVEIDSEPGAGTRMSVYFPAVAAEEIAPPAGGTPSAPVATVGGTILLVEDDDAVRRAASRILRDGGYDVIAAAGPREAIDVARDLTRPFDLLLTDVAMPDMSGPSLAAKLQAAQPGLPVVFASGYANCPDELPGGAHFVSKPFDGPALLAGVAAAWKS